MKELTDREFQVLLKEFELLNSIIKDLDTRIFQIKSWSISIFSAIIGLSILNNKPILLFIPLITSLLFWVIEGLYKMYQKIFIERLLEIENFFNKEKTNIKIAYISHSFKNKNKIKSLEKIYLLSERMLTFNVSILYLSKIAILFIISFIFI
ncbi:MAG: hypothetical protein GXO60_05605 [Epsilonproteobacteria bacterium]|nr:hypothetical protein [Campylobacterota bacterium]